MSGSVACRRAVTKRADGLGCLGGVETSPLSARAPGCGEAGGGGRREHDGQRGVQQLVVELQVPAPLLSQSAGRSTGGACGGLAVGRRAPRAERELEHRLQRVCEVAPKVAAEPVHAPEEVSRKWLGSVWEVHAQLRV